MGATVFCTIRDKGSYIIVIEEEAEVFYAMRSTSEKSEPIVSLNEFLEADELTIHPTAKEAVRRLLKQEKERKNEILSKANKNTSIKTCPDNLLKRFVNKILKLID